MINGFEEITHELTEYEIKTILPKVVTGLKTKIGDKNAVTNKHICDAFTLHGFNVTEPRFRKIVQHIRVSGLIPCLVSSSKGYYIATEKSEILKYIESFDQRINSMTISRDAIFHQMNRKFEK